MGWRGAPVVAAKQSTPQQTPVFEPAAMLDVEISRALPVEMPINGATGMAYRRALVLARLHTRPLGVIELFADDEGIGAERLARGIWAALRAKINEHLRDDGLPEVNELTPDGLAVTDTPLCIELRESFLASAPFVSVVIPTHNRPEQVVALVHSVLASDYPADAYEVIVVDNAPSSNATAEIIEQTFGSVSQVRYVREDRAGSANARNAGLVRARGEIVAFADDDELVDRHWLTETVRGFRAADDVVCVTGLVTPMESETPAQGWFEQFGGYCKEQCESRLFNLTDHRAKNPLYPYNIGSFGAGGSMAFRRSTLLAIDGFDPQLGPATPTLGGEDIDAMLRVILAGHSLFYQPAAIVRHPPYREYPQLRRQIQGYGTGLTACIFKNVVTKPRLLPGFIGKLPRGLIFAFSSRSPHHAGKQTGYPKELTRLELKGLLYGPLAYVLSRRQHAHVALLTVPAAQIEPLAVPAGEAR